MRLRWPWRCRECDCWLIFPLPDRCAECLSEPPFEGEPEVDTDTPSGFERYLLEHYGPPSTGTDPTAPPRSTELLSPAQRTFGGADQGL